MLWSDVSSLKNKSDIPKLYARASVESVAKSSCGTSLRADQVGRRTTVENAPGALTTTRSPASSPRISPGPTVVTMPLSYIADVFPRDSPCYHRLHVPHVKAGSPPPDADDLGRQLRGRVAGFSVKRKALGDLILNSPHPLMPLRRKTSPM